MSIFVRKHWVSKIKMNVPSDNCLKKKHVICYVKTTERAQTLDVINEYLYSNCNLATRHPFSQHLWRLLDGYIFKSFLRRLKSKVVKMAFFFANPPAFYLWMGKKFRFRRIRSLILARVANLALSTPNRKLMKSLSMIFSC